MALTALKVKNAKPGKLTDSEVKGLRLDVDARGGRSWVFRFTSPLTGKERYMGLGSASDISLDGAREAARQARKLILEGKDPIENRIAQRAAVKVEAARSVTFRQYAEATSPAWNQGGKTRSIASSGPTPSRPTPSR
jgi:Arm domain-containing DNA-binding protein